MSDCRSATPSFRVICQRAARLFSSWAAALACSSCAISASASSGFSRALSSACMVVVICSQTESTSELAERRSSRSAWASTLSRRNPISSGKPDSVLASLSWVRSACNRSVEDTGSTSAYTPALDR